MTGDFDISGKWINRLTGDVVVVRNTIIDGDDMIILTSDGRQLKMVDFQDYIQMSSDDKNPNDFSTLGDLKQLENERRVVVGQNSGVSNTVNTVSPNNDFYSLDEIEKTTTQKKPTNIPKKKQQVISDSEKLLSKLFEKINLDVDVKIDLNCNNFPSKELNMLQMIYDVTTDDISNYIIKNIINEDAFRSAVSAYIKEQLS